MSTESRPYWVSWYGITNPVSGERDGDPTICAAVMAAEKEKEWKTT